jgi:lipoyl(octanoyl) transferase
MQRASAPSLKASRADAVLQVYLLGSVDFEAALAFQRRLAYQVSCDPQLAFLVLCEHPPIITIGRQGSRTQVLCEPDELQARRWRVRWVNRGGGSILHLPGQLAIYPILSLDHQGLGVKAYLDLLHETVAAALDDFRIRGQVRSEKAGLWVGPRPIALTGVAVRDWVSYYGTYLNIHPDLPLFRRVRCGGTREEPMTSLERERHGPLRPSLVRERLIEYFAERFHFSETTIFFQHPSLNTKPAADAVASRA